MANAHVTLFLCGDLMTGRGVDQILPHPSLPEIDEPALKDARAYVQLAEGVSGAIPRPVGFTYVWGDGLGELERVAPNLRIANLETSITRSESRYPKGINYRMHPANAPCLTAASLDVVALANNHVLDYAAEGLVETIDVLDRVGIAHAGAGRNRLEAERPALLPLSSGGRVIVLALATSSSGISPDWSATEHRAGIDFIDLSEATAGAIGRRVRDLKQPGDLLVISLHWGSNWGYDVPPAQVRFAHRLIDEGVDVVYGHSSHHPRPIEVYRDRLILYGCGDLINDYEGIKGYEQYRDDLVLMYFPTFGRDGRLAELWMTPMQLRKLRLSFASPADVRWLQSRLEEIGQPFGSRIQCVENRLRLVPHHRGHPLP